jgi:hypothetical protein
MPHENRESHESEALPVVCPHCLARNSARDEFCRQCGTPLTSRAVTEPMGQVYSEGDTFNKAIENPSKPIVLIGMWLICGPTALISTCAIVGVFVWPFIEPLHGVQDVFLFCLLVVFVGGAAVIFDTMMYRITRNFIRQRRQLGRRQD